MSERYEAKGAVYAIGETKQVSQKFSKRELVLEVQDGKYSQIVSFEATNDKCSMLDELVIGEAVTVHFNLRGREWKSPSGEVKYFNTLTAWKIESERVDKKIADRSGTSVHKPAGNTSSGADDDIPFATCSMDEDPVFRR